MSISFLSLCLAEEYINIMKEKQSMNKENKKEVEPIPIDEKEVICALSDLYLQDLAYFAETDPVIFSNISVLCAEYPNKTFSFKELQPTTLFGMFNYMTSQLSYDQSSIVVVHGSKKTVQDILNRIAELHEMRKHFQKIMHGTKEE